MFYGVAQAQTTGILRYDSVVLQKVGGNSELRILNATRSVTGGLFTNVGNGLGRYIRPRVSNDTLFIGTDTLIVKVTGGAAQGIFANSQINNYLDSLRFQQVGAFAIPTIGFLYGTSIEVGNNASVPDSALEARLESTWGILFTNDAVSSRGTYVAISQNLQDIQPGHSSMVVFAGYFNDWRRGADDRRNQNQTINTSKSAFVNQMLSTVADAQTAFTFGGTWSSYAASTVGGKLNGKFTQTSGDSAVYSFTAQKNVAWGMIGGDSVNQAFALFSYKLYIPATGVVVEADTTTSNNQYSGQSDGANNNQRGPMAFFINGLSEGVTYKLVITSLQSTNTLALDYVGHMVDPGESYPIIWLKPTRMDATGYAVPPANGSNAVWTANNAILDSLYSAITAYAPGYPLFLSETDDYFDPNFPGGLASDHVHLSDAGFYQYSYAIFQQIPTIQAVPTAGSMVNVGGDPYWSTGSELIAMLGGGGSGTPGGSTTQLQYNNAGSFGGITSATSDGDDFLVDTVFGGSSSGGRLVLSSTQNATKGNIDFDNFARYDVANKRSSWANNTVTAAVMRLSGNTVNLSDDVLRTDNVASQTGQILRSFNSSASEILRIGRDGALHVGGGAITFPFSGVHLQVSGGIGYVDYINNSSQGIQGRIRFSSLNLLAGTSVNIAALDVASTGAVTINEGGVAINTRIESDNQANMFFVDGTNDRIGVGQGSPTARFHLIAGTATASNAPFKLTTGTVLTSPEAGAMEYNGNPYFTTVAANRIGIGGAIKDFIADSANTGTSEEFLYRYTTKASTLTNDGDKVIGYYTVNLSDITADKVIKFYYAGTQIYTSGTLTATTGTFSFKVTVIRTSSSTARATVESFSGATAGGGATASIQTDLTTLTFSNTYAISPSITVSGAGGGAGDATFKMGTVFFYPAANN